MSATPQHRPGAAPSDPTVEVVGAAVGDPLQGAPLDPAAARPLRRAQRLRPLEHLPGSASHLVVLGLRHRVVPAGAHVKCAATGGGSGPGKRKCPNCLGVPAAVVTGEVPDDVGEWLREYSIDVVIAW